MAELFLPVLHSFENDNIFTGSFGQMRFRIRPDPDAGTMLCEVWYGPYCYEKSEIEKSNKFALTEAGHSEMRAWLNEQIKGA